MRVYEGSGKRAASCLLYIVLLLHLSAALVVGRSNRLPSGQHFLHGSLLEGKEFRNGMYIRHQIKLPKKVKHQNRDQIQNKLASKPSLCPQ